MYIFFNEILNQMFIELKSFVDDRGELCSRVDFNTNTTKSLSTHEPEVSRTRSFYGRYL